MSLDYAPLDTAALLADADQIVRAWEQPRHPLGTEPSTERALTAYLLTEEVAELSAAVARRDLIETLDALVDTAYVVAGSMVRHEIAAGDDGDPYTPLADQNSVISSVALYLSWLADGGDPAAARSAALLTISSCAGAAASIGCEFAPLWNEVHRSNLSKLVDGRPVKDPVTGKATKPPTFEAPDLARVVADGSFEVPDEWWENLL